jgi:hypothetical protein
MKIFGDWDRFCIVTQLDADYCGVWLNGTLFFRISGNNIGDPQEDNSLRALLEIRYDRFSRGFERDSKAGCGRQHNEAAWPELHARRNAIRLI